MPFFALFFFIFSLSELCLTGDGRVIVLYLRYILYGMFRYIYIILCFYIFAVSCCLLYFGKNHYNSSAIQVRRYSGCATFFFSLALVLDKKCVKHKDRFLCSSRNNNNKQPVLHTTLCVHTQRFSFGERNLNRAVFIKILRGHAVHQT